MDTNLDLVSLPGPLSLWDKLSAPKSEVSLYQLPSCRRLSASLTASSTSVPSFLPHVDLDPSQIVEPSPAEAGRREEQRLAIERLSITSSGRLKRRVATPRRPVAPTPPMHASAQAHFAATPPRIGLPRMRVSAMLSSANASTASAPRPHYGNPYAPARTLGGSARGGGGGGGGGGGRMMSGGRWPRRWDEQQEAAALAALAAEAAKDAPEGVGSGGAGSPLGGAEGGARERRQRQEAMAKMQKRSSLREWEEQQRRNAAAEFKIQQKQMEEEERIQSFRAAFAVIDEDGSGQVDPGEVLKTVKDAGYTVNEEHFWKNFLVVDTDRNGQIDQNEFIHILSRMVSQVAPRLAVAVGDRLCCSCPQQNPPSIHGVRRVLPHTAALSACPQSDQKRIRESPRASAQGRSGGGRSARGSPGRHLNSPRRGRARTIDVRDELQRASMSRMTSVVPGSAPELTHSSSSGGAGAGSSRATMAAAAAEAGTGVEEESDAGRSGGGTGGGGRVEGWETTPAEEAAAANVWGGAELLEPSSSSTSQPKHPQVCAAPALILVRTVRWRWTGGVSECARARALMSGARVPAMRSSTAPPPVRPSSMAGGALQRRRRRPCSPAGSHSSSSSRVSASPRSRSGSEHSSFSGR
jgi:hypothetical protein